MCWEELNKARYEIHNNRNRLNTGNTACNLVEQYHCKFCNFERDLISRKWLGLACDKNTSITKKKESQVKRKKYWQNKLETFVPYGLNKRVEYCTYYTNIVSYTNVSIYAIPQTPFFKY